MLETCFDPFHEFPIIGMNLPAFNYTCSVFPRDYCVAIA